MSIISNVKKWFGINGGTPNPVDPFWYALVNKSGFSYSPENAMRISAVLACVRVISESCSTLPCHLYQKKERGRERAEDHYLQEVLNESPNPWMTTVEFYDQMLSRLLLKGNALYRRIPGPRGAVGVLDPIDPDDVIKVELLEDYRKRFHFRGGEFIDSHETLHVMGMSLDGLWGVSVLEYARNTIGIASGAEKMGQQLFEQGLRPSGVLTHPANLSGPAQDRLKKQIAQDHAGDFHGAFVLEEGMKWEQLSVTPEDAQFLETRKFQVEEICRIFRVPLHLVQDLEHATFSNIEHQSIEFVTHTLRPWLVRIEKAIKRDLIYQKGLYPEFVTEALLRGDISTRYEAYMKALQGKFMNSNEVRAKENMNPRDGGDEFENPMITVEKNPKPEDIKQPEPPEQPPKDGANGKNPLRAAAVLLASGIAEKAAVRERAQLMKRAKHASADRKKFTLWAQEWYANQTGWLMDACTPFCLTFGVDLMPAIEQQTTEVVESLLGCDDINQWIENRAGEASLELAITNSIMEVYDEIPNAG